MAGFIELLTERLAELWLRTGEHLMLTGVSTGMAILIGIPVGICAARVRWLRGSLLGAVGILQTIPSLAMLAILLAVLQKIGALPAIIALTLYALLPIVRNTLTGLEGVPNSVVEAARGIGMTRHQRLWWVELPLALPVMIAGVRTAAVVCVGIATLSAFIGAGGLGEFINRGLALSNTNLILLGAIPAAVLALLVDGCIAALQWGLERKRPRGTDLAAKLDPVLRPVALALPVLLIVAGVAAYTSRQSIGDASDSTPPKAVIAIGSKNFTEQFILGEIMAQLIEARTDLAVRRRFNLGGTMICHGAVKNGGIDMYVEYTGTGLTAILGREVIADPDAAYDVVKNAYAEQFGLEWLPPLGFNNTYALTMRKGDAKTRSVRSITELGSIAPSLRAGFVAEFSERPDGYPGLKEAYGFAFGEVMNLDPTLMYQAIASEEVDVICAFTTDGRIAAYNLLPLTDDRGFFPPYYAAPVVRQQTLQTYPELGEALAPLAGLLDETTMQKLNYAVDETKESPAAVARAFLVKTGLLPVPVE